MKKFDLVIFDCDGVIVDSEYLASKIAAELISAAGFKISSESLNKDYAGLIFVDILKEIERRSGVPLSSHLIDDMRRLFNECVKTKLTAITGVRAAIKRLTHPYCICSNSSQQSIELMLKKVGLYDLFSGKTYSAPEVGTKKQKPAPDIYLYAAEQFGADPKNTVVIEDSVPGVTGAYRAGTRVIGFTGGKHSYAGHADALTEAGAETVISRFRDLSTVIQAMETWHSR